MVASLAAGDVALDLRVQLQPDPHRMPIENNGVLWPERLSPRVAVATLRLPRQTFDSAEQFDFASRHAGADAHADRVVGRNDTLLQGLEQLGVRDDGRATPGWRRRARVDALDRHAASR